ncbi:glutathione ABC transporter substrate-binding protein [Alkaliphilus sp. B6464]|nr:glutathione ABC transporter substrate-binding protein [Alkaliphilus sp. B6464]
MLIFTMAFIGFASPFTHADNSSTCQLTNEAILRQQDALHVGQGYDARSLDPHAANDTVSSRVIKQIYETLVNQNDNIEIEPGLAESWTRIDDVTIEFKLKKGVKFHNGEEFTSNDVKFTLLRGIESPSVGHVLWEIDPNKIKIVDDYTIQIATKEPDSSILANLAHAAGSMLNEKAVTEAGDDYGQNPVGTGAFKFDIWNIEDSIELVKFNDYHDEPAKVERVVFKNIPEDTDRFDEFKNGKLHIAYDISPDDIQKLEDKDEVTVQRSQSLSATYIGFNTQKEPYNDIRVRQAINYAVDMDMIVETVMKGAAQVASGPLGPSVWAYNDSLEPYEYNVKKAKQLMKEAGYPNGLKTSIWVNDNQQRINIATIVVEQLKEIGIEAEIEVVEWGVYLDGTADGKHDIFLLGWVTVNGDPHYGLYSQFHSSQFGYLGNRTLYSNKKVDELLDKGKSEADPEIRKKYYLEVQEIIREEAPWIFSWTIDNINGVRNNVKGFSQHPSGYHQLSGVYLE